MQGSGSFGYKYISVEESTAANVLYCNGTLVHLAADQIPKGFAVSYKPLCTWPSSGKVHDELQVSCIVIHKHPRQLRSSSSVCQQIYVPRTKFSLGKIPSLLLHQAFGNNYLKFCLHSIKIEDIGLYRENAIAIQDESGDSNGGNV